MCCYCLKLLSNTHRQIRCRNPRLQHDLKIALKWWLEVLKLGIWWALDASLHVWYTLGFYLFCLVKNANGSRILPRLCSCSAMQEAHHLGPLLYSSCILHLVSGLQNFCDYLMCLFQGRTCFLLRRRTRQRCCRFLQKKGRQSNNELRAFKHCLW